MFHFKLIINKKVYYVVVKTSYDNINISQSLFPYLEWFLFYNDIILGVTLQVTFPSLAAVNLYDLINVSIVKHSIRKCIRSCYTSLIFPFILEINAVLATMS